jgi:hypothetical protein
MMEFRFSDQDKGMRQVNRAGRVANQDMQLQNSSTACHNA